MEPIDHRLLRLAVVHEWSDAFITHFLTSCEMRGITGDNILATAEKATEDLNIGVLRQGTDPALMESGALGLGFDSASAMKEFQQRHPFLSEEWGATYVHDGCTGTVVALSMTEVVITTERGHHIAFERARLNDQCVGVLDIVTVRSTFGPVIKQPVVVATQDTAVDETASPGF